jgi:hypothetical protein
LEKFLGADAHGRILRKLNRDFITQIVCGSSTRR